MVHNIVIIALGFVLWKINPGKTNAGSKKDRTYIDLASQNLGITILLTGALQLVKYFINLF